MNAILLTILAAGGKMAVSILTSLLTENFLKHVIVITLEKIVDKTDTDFDNKLLADIKAEWGIKDEKPSATPPN